jgi:hypothetical protein
LRKGLVVFYFWIPFGYTSTTCSSVAPKTSPSRNEQIGAAAAIIVSKIMPFTPFVRVDDGNAWDGSIIGEAGDLLHKWTSDASSAVQGMAKGAMHFVDTAYEYVFEWDWIQWAANMCYILAVLAGYYYLPRDLMLVLGLLTFSIGPATMELVIDFTGIVRHEPSWSSNSRPSHMICPFYPNAL